ncbi:MAG: MerC domain-containing protein [Bacteroidota bacterium]
MINAIKTGAKSDIWGSAASTLCLAHCLATPFLFAAHTGHVHGHHEHPFWWGVLDLVFIGVSMLAVYWSARHTSKQWMRFALWVSWGLLTFVILNEKLQMVHLAEAAIYFPSLALVGLHLYNRKYCQCANDACCVNDE